MRLVKAVLFLVLLSSLIGLIYYIQNFDEDSIQMGLQDQIAMDSNSESLLQEEILDTSQILPSNIVSAAYEDIEVHVVQSTLIISKSNQEIYKKDFPKLTIRQILMADLNEDDAPECWILGSNSSNKSDIFALEISSGQINQINFPTLKGRQAFGYAGNDTLYFEKSSIVRQFKFVNDPYADLSSGNRACYYQFGVDQSFILKKTLDLE